MPAVRQPVIFVPHGGGPCFWIEFPPPFGPHAWDNLRDYLAGVLKSLPERPKAFLVVTAHWEADKPTVSVNPKPGMLYDYNGFPPHTYKLSYPAPGDPALAAEGKRLIEQILRRREIARPELCFGGEAAAAAAVATVVVRAAAAEASMWTTSRRLEWYCAWFSAWRSRLRRSRWPGAAS